MRPTPSTRLSTAERKPDIAANRNVDSLKLSKAVKGELDWVVMKALEKDRNRRYQTANGLARDIQRYLSDELVEARPPSTAYRMRKFARRHKPQAVAAASVLLALLAGIVGTTFGLVRAEQQRHVAERAQAEEKQRAEEANAARAAAIAQRTKAEDAASREREALAQQTITLADSHASLGLSAGEQNKPYEAMLWFASAANIARQVDPQRESDSRTRLATWARRLAYPVAALPHPGKDVTRLAFHRGGDYLLVFFGDGGYRLCDIRTGQTAKLPIAADGQRCAEWSPDGKLLALGDARGEVDIYAFPECRLLHALKHPGTIRVLHFSDDGSYLAIGSEVVRVWSTVKKDFVSGEILHPQPVVGIDFDSQSRRVVTSCLDNKARVFAIDGDGLAARPLFPPADHAAKTTLFLASGFCATFVANSGLLVTKDYNSLRWLDAETGAEIPAFASSSGELDDGSGQPRSKKLCRVRQAILSDPGKLRSPAAAWHLWNSLKACSTRHSTPMKNRSSPPA